MEELGGALGGVICIMISKMNLKSSRKSWMRNLGRVLPIVNPFLQDILGVHTVGIITTECHRARPKSGFIPKE